MSGLVEAPLDYNAAEFLLLYRSCPPKAQAIIRETATYLAATRLEHLQRQMLDAGMTRQADGSWKGPA